MSIIAQAPVIHPASTMSGMSSRARRAQSALGRELQTKRVAAGISVEDLAHRAHLHRDMNIGVRVCGALCRDQEECWSRQIRHLERTTQGTFDRHSLRWASYGRTWREMLELVDLGSGDASDEDLLPVMQSYIADSKAAVRREREEREEREGIAAAQLVVDADDLDALAEALEGQFLSGAAQRAAFLWLAELRLQDRAAIDRPLNASSNGVRA